MKKALAAILVACCIALIAAVYLYSERLLQAEPEQPPTAASAALAPSEPEPVAAPADGQVAARPGASLLFWRDPSSGQNAVWRSAADGAVDGAIDRRAVQALDAVWKARIFVAGGWDGDDLLIWRNDKAGELRMWRLTGQGALAAFGVLPYSGEDWRIVAARDMDGDGDADLVWTGPKRNVAVWTLEDGTVEEQQVVGVARNGWQLIAAADIDGDAVAELLWREPAGGQMVFWDMNGTAPATQRELPGVPADWSLLGTGQLDEQGPEDLLWSGPGGALAVWRGASAANAVLIRRPMVPDWAFIGLADIDGNGRADLLWRHRTDRTVGAWSIADDGAVTDLALPAPPPGAEPVPTGFAAP